MTTPHTPKPIDTKEWQKRDRDVVIDTFIVTAVRMPDEFEDTSNPQPRQLIHWRGGGAYKQRDKERSTSYDTRKWIITDPEVEVQLISKNFAVSSTAVGYWATPLAKSYTTTDIYKLIEDKHLNHFLYNGNGSGCLTWITRLVKELEDAGVLPAGALASLNKKVDEVRANPEYWVPAEPGAVFY
ncbi:hypothetical protein K466DRAFT_593430 [Polyporus arcularius HHB13444]|uniref:DUF7770 domain-containing protein n=1 Tax=Polyporus arcularius HHB13444 TaxID=1314778 RepID=A0A5C3PXK9_9APHY|nr:hypothetical protein K466DRAFT_593430 [Polyporus arcularius HHB13444]